MVRFGVYLDQILSLKITIFLYKNLKNCNFFIKKVNILGTRLLYEVIVVKNFFLEIMIIYMVCILK